MLTFSPQLKQCALADEVFICHVVQRCELLIAVAQCLASECGASELWEKLSGATNDNPLAQWSIGFTELHARMQLVEYEPLIAEAGAFIERAKTLQGSAARQQEAILLGRLGELLFHSGRVDESIAPFRSALTLCSELNDVEGQLAYLNNLLEAHCYTDDRQAIPLHKSTILATKGNELASAGKYSDALEMYNEASEIDPHDPDRPS